MPDQAEAEPPKPFLPDQPPATVGHAARHRSRALGTARPQLTAAALFLI